MILMEQEPQTQAFKAYFDQDLFAAQCGISIVEMRSGYARTQMVAEDRHLNSFGAVHGGRSLPWPTWPLPRRQTPTAPCRGAQLHHELHEGRPQGPPDSRSRGGFAFATDCNLPHSHQDRYRRAGRQFQGMAYRKGVPLEKAGRLDTGTDTPPARHDEDPPKDMFITRDFLGGCT